MDGLDELIDYDYRGNEKGSLYWDYYYEQILELSMLAADMYNEMDSIKGAMWRLQLPEKQIEFCEEDSCTQTCIAWWNTAACMLSDIDMSVLLENENLYGMEENEEKAKRVRAMARLTKKQYMELQTLVLGFIMRYLELVNAFEVITSCIRELDYHQSPVQGKTGVELADAAYL